MIMEPYSPSQVERIDDFIEQRPLNQKSRLTYWHTLRRFYRWIHDHGVDYDFIKFKDIQAFFNELEKQNRSDLTQYNYRSIVQLHFKWLHENNLIAYDVSKSIRIGKRDYNIFRKRPLTADEAAQLLAVIKPETIIGQRDYALISLLLLNGIRVIECNRLDIGDIGHGTIKIQRKGRHTKGDVLRLTATSQQALTRYIAERGTSRYDQPVFVSHSHRSMNQRLTTKAISAIVKKYLEQIGINEKQVTAHSLRHTAATLLLKNRVGQNDLQGFLGHASFETSKHYIRWAEGQRIFDLNLPEKLEQIIFNPTNHVNYALKDIERQKRPFKEVENIMIKGHAGI
jgi:integrase/recombinase XerD